MANMEIMAEGIAPMKTKFETNKEKSAMPSTTLRNVRNLLKNFSGYSKQNTEYRLKTIEGDSVIFPLTDRNSSLPESWEVITTENTFAAL